MKNIERPISDRAKAVATSLEEHDFLCNPFRDRARILEIVQQALDESFEDGISEYITTNPPRDR